MDDSLTSQAAEQLEVMADVIARLRDGDTVDRAQFERVLEQGLACLLGMRAELRRREAHPPAAAEAAGEPTGELAEWVLRLSDTLTELRTQFDPQASAVGYGFVLPRREPGPDPRSSRSHGHRG